jgi:predicted short-subunit dehydrogenase-like oxidoreductase (DUF2520 family)
MVWSRSRASIRRCIAPAGRRARAAASLAELVRWAQILMVCVSDAAIEGCLREASRARGNSRDPLVVLVTSGSADLFRLRRVCAKEIALGRFHPLAPVPERSAGLYGAAFGIEGDRRARQCAQGLLARWDGLSLELRPGRSARYHAGAALLGGGLISLWALAERTMGPAVRSRAALRNGLRSFVGLINVHAQLLGPADALTGPVARGSVAVVRRHLRALDPDARRAYRALGPVMLGLARHRGSLDARTARELSRLFRG